MTANIRRTFNALLVVAIAILGGGALAYWLGNQFALASGRHETQAYALNLLQRAEILAHETDQSLEEANASPGQPCSSNDLEYIRQITFKYRFIKDIGRIIDGRLTCTSFRGVLASPSIASSPDLIIANGLKIWANIRLPLAPSVNSVLVETGKTNIVIDPGAFQDLEQPPFRYSIAIVNVAKGKVLRSWGQSLVSDAVLISGDRAFTAGAQLYDVECSQPYAICSVAALSVHDALEKQRSFVAGFTLFGAAGAGLAALVVLLLRGRDRTLLERLREAIKSEELKIVYQPIHHLGSGSVVAAEALIRWTDHNGTAIPPDVFIPVAEEAGIASDITRYVLKTVAAEAGPFLRKHTEFRITVNIVAADFGDPEFYATLDESMKISGIAPTQIGLELTERSTADRDIAVAAIAQLRQSQHVVYLDDFGTGYSSLAYLQELNVSVIKIDRAFTSTIGTASVKVPIVPQILEMARSLEMGVVVEGIETREQCEYFASAFLSSCGQGWYFARPMPFAELLIYMAELVPDKCPSHA